MRYVLILVAGLAGCGPTQREATATTRQIENAGMEARADQETRACQAPIPAVQGRMAERYRCFAAARQASTQANANGDLLITAQARVLAVISRYDAGAITWEEAEAQRAEIASDTITQARTRFLPQMGGALVAVPVFIPPSGTAPAPAPIYQPPSTTRCQNFGGIVRCASY